MSMSKYYGFAILLIVAAAVATWVAYPQLPATVATHWDIHNQPNGYSPKSVIFIFGPGMMAGMLVLAYCLPWLSPKRFEVDGFRSTYLYIMLLILALVAYVYGIILWAGTGHARNVGRAVVGGISLLFLFLGNVLGKVRRNFYVGVRTPWALANERVWNATQRFAGKAFVVAGVYRTLVCRDWRGWVALDRSYCGRRLIPVIYSLVIYKQMEKRGELVEAHPGDNA
jgi:uncharacterized membrane protein